eukprot:scaffold1362_cov163-Amphora_coffeaeformis.AAC.13
MTTTASTTTPWTVGSMARVALPDNPKLARRAVIATFDDSKASILWEERYPNPFPYQPRFVVAPSSLGSGDDVEIEVPLEQLQPLLDFEKDPQPPLAPTTTTTQANNHKPKKLDKSVVLRWKDRGDQLLKLGDAPAALPYYEYALHRTCLMESIGSSVLVKKEGFVQVAEVDCVNEDNSMDIMWKDTEEEVSLMLSDNLLTILEPHCDNIQERILLNLTRCLIQLAESGAQRRAAYAKAATLAATLALVLAEYHDGPTSERMPTALLLRAQAQAILLKFAHAHQDLQRILDTDPEHRQALKMLHQLSQKQKETQQRDKTLAKEVCKWVETSTAAAQEPPPAKPKQQPNESAAKDDLSSKLWSYFTCSTLE